MQLLAQVDALSEELYFLTKSLNKELLNSIEDDELMAIKAKIEDVYRAIEQINQSINKPAV